MPTAVWITGFEHGLATPVTSGGGIASTVTGSGVSIQGTVKRTGDFALALDSTGGAAAERLAKNLASASSCIVARLYFCFATIPATTRFNLFNTNIASSPCIDISTGGKFCSSFGGDNIKASTVGPTADSTTWYRIDARFTLDGVTATIDWAIDGVAQTQNTFSLATTTMATWQIGWGQSVAAKFYVDDVFISATSADYPIGAGGVVGLRPDADGTHNNAADTMEDEDGNDIHATNFPAYAKLDDNPWISTANDDLVKQSTVGNARYAEVTFADTAQTNIQGVMALLQYASSGTNQNGAAAIIIDEDATATELYGTPAVTKDYSETSAYYKNAILPAPAGGWDLAAVNALKARIGYADDVADVPYWLALILEVAYSINATLFPSVISGGFEVLEETATGEIIATNITAEPNVMGAKASLVLPDSVNTVMIGGGNFISSSVTVGLE